MVGPSDYRYRWGPSNLQAEDEVGQLTAAAAQLAAEVSEAVDSQPCSLLRGRGPGFFLKGSLLERSLSQCVKGPRLQVMLTILQSLSKTCELEILQLFFHGCAFWLNP